jgi:hypothetical protein
LKQAMQKLDVAKLTQEILRGTNVAASLKRDFTS